LNEIRESNGSEGSLEGRGIDGNAGRRHNRACLNLPVLHAAFDGFCQLGG